MLASPRVLLRILEVVILLRVDEFALRFEGRFKDKLRRDDSFLVDEEADEKGRSEAEGGLDVKNDGSSGRRRDCVERDSSLEVIGVAQPGRARIKTPAVYDRMGSRGV